MIDVVVGPNKGKISRNRVKWGKIPLFARFPYFNKFDKISTKNSKVFEKANF